MSDEIRVALDKFNETRFDEKAWRKEKKLKDRILVPLISISTEAYRLHLKAMAAGYTIDLVKSELPRGYKAEAKRQLAKLAGAK